MTNITTRYTPLHFHNLFMKHKVGRWGSGAVGQWGGGAVGRWGGGAGGRWGGGAGGRWGGGAGGWGGLYIILKCLPQMWK